MTYSTSEGDPAIEGTNSLALRMAIGERLQDSLDQRMALPPQLASLLKQMRLSEVPVHTR
jgi:hypothetical protein